MKCLLVLSTLISLGCCINLNAYPFSAVLNADGNGNPRYTLHWNFSVAEETITFAVNVSTNGWVGFGISPNGGMTNSDVVIGWVNDDGQTFFHDRFALGQSRPPIDPQQDWTLLNGENTNGYTVMEFWRKWVTCDIDDRDRDILVDTSRVVYAWNDNDPVNDDAVNGPIYHGVNRGAASLNLLSGVTNPQVDPDPNNVQSFTIGVENVMIPSQDTTYWCAAVELPTEIQQQKQYIIRHSPRITPNGFQYVHHMLIYLCNYLNETEVGSSAPCFGQVGQSVSECLQGSLIAGWAVGGTDFIYPDNVAYPLGGQGSSRYVVIQMHYDNPNMNSGIVDSSGIEFFYTSQRREQEAGILNLGHVVNRFMVVPPRANNFTIIGKCGGECTSQHFPPEGIKIFGNLLHTHLVGRGLTLRLIRNTTQCGGLEELKPVDQNLQYDFNFQQFTILPNEVTVLPGDILLLECNYDTSANDGVTLGGEATREEMCLSFPVYYPRTPLSLCSSTPGDTAFNQFAASFIPPENISALVTAWTTGSNAEAEAALNQYIDWTPAAAQALEESVRSGNLLTICGTDQSNFTVTAQESLPNIICPYEAPERCPAMSTAEPTDEPTDGPTALPTTEPTDGATAGATSLIGNMVSLTLLGLVALTLFLL